MKNLYIETERKLVEFCLDKKLNKNKRNWKLKEEFDNLLNSYIQNNDEKNINNNLTEYKIKAAENKYIYKDEIYKDRKIINDLLKEFSFEIITNPERFYLEEE